MTTFGFRRVGDPVNIEIERQTQVFVDTVREAIDKRPGLLLPALRALLGECAVALDDLAPPAGAPPLPPPR
jgi:riboflavin synthase